MILYLDTSALLKIYLLEEGTEAVKSLRDVADVVSTSLVAYAEARAGLARARRDDRLTDHGYTTALRQFEADWVALSVRDVGPPLIRLAGDLAAKYFLRGFDAIHLASAVSLQQELGERITFSASDDRLMKAADTEGILTAD